MPMLKANCLIVGDEAVGKTAIAQVFQSDNCQFPKNYIMTTSLEISSKVIQLPDLRVNLEIFIMGTSGKEMFYEMNVKQLTDPDMVIVVYDVTNEESFKAVEKWFERIKSLKNSRDMTVVLAGNKVDLEDQRVIKNTMAEEFANSKDVTYMECSAKNILNVTEIFQHLAQQYCSKHDDYIKGNSEF